MLNQQLQCLLSSNLLGSFHGTGVRKKKIQKTALAWWQEQHSCDARVPSGNKERTRLEHRLANTLHRQPQRPSQGPCARGNALARKHGDSALQIHLHNSASGKGKKKIKALKQFGKICSIYILISETQQGFSGLLCPALGKVATTGGFLCHYSGWRNTYN